MHTWLYGLSFSLSKDKEINSVYHFFNEIMKYLRIHIDVLIWNLRKKGR